MKYSIVTDNKCPSSEKDDQKCILRKSYFHQIQPKYTSAARWQWWLLYCSLTSHMPSIVCSVHRALWDLRWNFSTSPRRWPAAVLVRRTDIFRAVTLHNTQYTIQRRLATCRVLLGSTCWRSGSGHLASPQVSCSQKTGVTRPQGTWPHGTAPPHGHHSLWLTFSLHWWWAMISYPYPRL